ADTPYFYRIKAKNGDGDVAAASVVVTTRTLAVPAPVIIGISPTSAKNLGISTFSLTGNNFLTGAVVTFRNDGFQTISPLTATVINSTLIQGSVNLTGAWAGPWDLLVENTDGKRSTGSGNNILAIANA